MTTTSNIGDMPTTTTSRGGFIRKFNWTEDLLFILAKEVHYARAYKHTKNTAMKGKWEMVLTRLKTNYPIKDGPGTDDFALLDIVPVALQNHFKRNMKEIMKKHGISEEGANLSGLPELPSEYESLMITMAKDEFKEKSKRKRESAKKEATKKLMDSINREGLTQQGELSNDTSIVLGEDDDDSENDDSGANKKKMSPDSVVSMSSSNKEFNAMNYIDSIINEFRQKEEDPLDREMKLEAINASKQQAEAFKAQADYYKFMMNNK